MMKIKSLWSFFLYGAILVFVSGCVEPLEIETGTYEDALVIEGTITDELAFQEIFLSRTYRLEESGPSFERNAIVRVAGNSNVYEFQEEEPGKYVSVEAFEAQQGITYTLEITTSDGKKYRSEAEELPQKTEISNLYAQKTTLGGETGIAILVDVQSAGGASGFYRYEFSETYKIVSPFVFGYNLRVVDGEFVEIPKTRQETVCYATERSKEVLLANTNIQAGNDLNAFLVKFMNAQNFRTAYRYSILVKQYSISAEAYSYYQTLKDFSESESLFSQNQLGLINGNVFSVSDSDEAVIGMFSVAGVSQERIFFSFEDFYDRKEVSSNTHVECKVQFPMTMTRAQRESIGYQLEIGAIKYLGFEVGETGNDYRFIKAGCVDCTVYGTNVAPDFWEE